MEREFQAEETASAKAFLQRMVGMFKERLKDASVVGVT